MAKKSTTSKASGGALDFSSLASDLITKWSSSSDWGTRSKDASMTIDKEKVALALQVMAEVGSAGGIDVTKLAQLADKAQKMELIKNAIIDFQERTGVLETDGILGIKTWKALKDLKACPHADDNRKKNLSSSSLAKLFNATRTKAFIYYHVDESMRKEKIGGEETRGLIIDAWNLWVELADLNIVEVDQAKHANVIVNMRKLGDGPGGTLGIAHIGGRGISQQLECSMDQDERWTPRKFLTAICHEFGHILGLRHDETPNQLMNAFLSDEINRPMENDKRRIQSEWGPRTSRSPIGVKSGDEGKIAGL